MKTRTILAVISIASGVLAFGNIKRVPEIPLMVIFLVSTFLLILKLIKYKNNLRKKDQ